MNSYPFYKQHDSVDCGPTCLRMIGKYYGKKLAIEKLKIQSQQNREGVSLQNISNTAEKNGLKSLIVKITAEQLVNDAPVPSILHWNQNHFVVLYKANKNNFIIADPAKEIIKYKKKDFLKNWISTNEGDEDKGIALLLEPTITFYDQVDEINSVIGWGLLSKYLLKYKVHLFHIFLGLFIGSLLQLFFPFLTQSIVDNGINTNNLGFIKLLLIAQFTLLFARTIVDFIRSRILLFISTHINLSILSDFWIKLMKLPLSYFDSRQSGDIMQRINDHHRIEGFITGTALQTIFALFNLFIFSLVLLYFNITVFSIFAIGTLLYFFWIRLFLKYRRQLDYKKFSLASKENSATMQLIQGMQEIKLNNAEHLKRWEWEGLQASLFRLNFKTLSLNQYQQTGAFFINEGKNILITYIVATLVLSGTLTLGQMLAIQFITGQLNNPVEQLIQFIQQAQDARISLERLNEVRQLKDEETVNSIYNNDLLDDHSIHLVNVRFNYPGSSDKPVIKNLNTVFPAGKVTAIVGMSGSGKTTILKLIQKFYDDYEGELKIGGNNLKYISPYYWRSITGSVMQDGFIFSDSIRNNIAFSEETIDYEQLIHACKVANILSFVETLPLGFNTKIGAEGNGLSAGQKQRILIARAVYKNPLFLLFDEATNALDGTNENIIMQNLTDFFENRTVIIVAHRLSTIKKADKIIVMQDGEIIEEGDHQILTSKKGKYYELVKNQLELGN